MISTLIWLAVLPSALLIYRVLKSDKVVLRAVEELGKTSNEKK